MELCWSDWTSWESLKVDRRSGQGVIVPNKIPGVYEVSVIGSGERLTIGGTTNLRRRIKRDLVNPKGKHSAGKKIRASEDTSKIELRWAITNRPAAAEEDLHMRYVAKFGQLPEYTKHT